MTHRRQPVLTQPELDFEFGLPAGREFFTVKWLANFFCCSQQHWINLIDEGHIPAANLATPGATKSMYRIARADLLRHLRKVHTHSSL